MNKFLDILQDILFVSKLTRTKNKKILIFLAIALSQLTAGSDLLLIAIFASIIAGQITNIQILNQIIEIIIQFKFLIVLVVIFRYSINFLQYAILKRIEIDVVVSLKQHMFKKVLDQKNFSTSDTYYFIDTLSTHISFFYSNFASFLNHFLQASAYLIYLIFADLNLISYFVFGSMILFYPILKLIKLSRNLMHSQWLYGKDANKEVVNAVENLPLIKILRMEEYALKNFTEAIKFAYEEGYKNYRITFLTQQLPNFFTILIFAIILNLPKFVLNITLDFLGVTIRLFQSLSTLSNSFNMVANSQIHIKEFVRLEKNNLSINKDYFSITNNKKIELKNIDFKYFNSENYIFKNLNLSIPINSHSIIIGPNGSGKSTLLGLIGNVLRPEKGSLHSFTDKFGYIGATPYILSASLRENLTYGLNSEFSDYELINLMRELLLFKEESSFNLNRTVDNNSLSSGQMQKIAFIRAIVLQPDVLLLDEAMANLDDRSKKLILNKLSDLKITIINSTHEPEKFEKFDNLISIEVENEHRFLRIEQKK